MKWIVVGVIVYYNIKFVYLRSVKNVRRVLFEFKCEGYKVVVVIDGDLIK